MQWSDKVVLSKWIVIVVWLALGLWSVPLWAQEPAAAEPEQAQAKDEGPPSLDQEASRELLAKARALVEDNQLDAALGLYNKLLEQYPRQHWLALEIGGALSDVGRFAEALPYLERAHKGDSLNMEAALRTALCLDALGLQDRAIVLYKRILMLNPDHISARFSLGRLQYETGLFDAAEGTYRDLISREPSHWMALNNLGLVLLDRDQPTAALSPLRRAHRLKPDDPGVTHNLGRALSAKGQHERALRFYDKALVLWGEDDLAAVRLHFDRGNALFALERFELAAKAYRRALELDPGYAPAQLNLGAALANLGRYDDAVAALESAVDYNAERVAIYHQIALNHMAMDDHQTALVHLNRARMLDESNPQTFLLLGRVHAACGESEASRRALERACRLGAREACR